MEKFEWYVECYLELMTWLVMLISPFYEIFKSVMKRRKNVRRLVRNNYIYAYNKKVRSKLHVKAFIKFDNK